MSVSISYVLLKAAFTAIIAAILWFAWFKYKALPNAGKSALLYGALMFVALAVAFYIFELLI